MGDLPIPGSRCTMPKVKLFSVTIKDCRVECLASTGGAGGQNKNRRHTAVRITHVPSGAVGFSADENNQLRNKQDAFRRMAEAPAFQSWARLIASELQTGKSIEQQVEEEMDLRNIKTEVKDEQGRWRIATSQPPGQAIMASFWSQRLAESRSKLTASR